MPPFKKSSIINAKSDSIQDPIASIIHQSLSHLITMI